MSLLLLMTVAQLVMIRFFQAQKYAIILCPIKQSGKRTGIEKRFYLY